MHIPGKNYYSLFLLGMCRYIFFSLWLSSELLAGNALLAATTSPSQSTHSEKKSDDALKRVQQELIEINLNLKQKLQTKNKQIKKIQVFDRDIAHLQRQLAGFEAKKKLVSIEIDGLKKSSRLLHKDIDNNKKKLSKMTLALYKLGGQGQLKIMLGRGELNERHRIRLYYDYIYQAFAKQERLLTDDLTQMEEIETALSEKLKKYDDLLQKYKIEHAASLKKRVAKKAYLEKLDGEIRQKKVRVRYLKTSRQALQKVLDALKKRRHLEEMARLSGMSFAKRHKGKLKWPVKGKIKYKFGQGRAKTGLKWRGIFISTKTGVGVHAVDFGTVVFSDWLTGYGFVLIIDHGKGYMSLYGHNQQLLIPVGQTVKADEIIAEAGSSGRLGRPGLYFEIRYNGKPINPLKWVGVKRWR